MVERREQLRRLTVRSGSDTTAWGPPRSPRGGPQAALTATPCRVTFTATRAQPCTVTSLKYDPAADQFLYTWALAKDPTGTAALTVTVTHPGTTTVSTKPEQITITR